MFKNDKLHRALNKEHKFARQFVIAAVLILVVNANVMIYILQQIDKLPNAYWIQLAFIPALLILMGFYYFRQHRKSLKHIREDFENEMLKKDE